MRRAARWGIAALCALALPTGCETPEYEKLCGSPGCSREGPPKLELMYLFLDRGELADADAILKNLWPVPRYEPVVLPEQLTWTENPFEEKYWRFMFYSMRATAPLLAAWRETGKRVYRDKLMEVVTSFYERGQESSFSRDKHSTAYRAMVLTNIYAKLARADAFRKGEEAMLRTLISNTGLFLADPDHFDRDYNHGITEAAALVLIAANFPKMEGAAEWGLLGRARLDSLMNDAVGTDGVANELSPYYHFYILTALWQVLAWGKINDIEVTARLEPTVDSMIRFGTYIVQPNGYIPMIAASLVRNMRSYEREVYDEIRGRSPEFDYVMTAGERGHEPTERYLFFPSSSFAILRSGFGAGEEFEAQTHLVFDLSPYRTIQSQHDALSINLYSAGRTLLADSGLYSYVEGPEREYFIGTSAHNTVLVDGVNQGEGAAIPALAQQGEGWLYQSGYHELYAGVRHARAVLMLQRDLVLVLDRLTSAAPHRYTQMWHFPPDVTVSAEGDGTDATGPVLALRQALPEGQTVESVRGATAPIDGWYSEEYQVKVPNQVLRYTKDAPSADFATLFATGPFAALPARAQATPTPTGMAIELCAGGRPWRVAIENLAGAGESVAVEPDAVGVTCP